VQRAYLVAQLDHFDGLLLDVLRDALVGLAIGVLYALFGCIAFAVQCCNVPLQVGVYAMRGCKLRL